MSPAEVTTLQAPPQYHMCIPRQSLLPFVTKEVYEHFLPYAPPLSNEMWVEHNGDPLRWQLPAGVLFDILVGEEASEHLPWSLTVRFQGFPADTLLRASAEAAEGVLLNALKESCFLACGSSLPAMKLSSEAQQQLALAVTTSDYRSFAEVDKQLQRSIASTLGGPDAPVKAVPLRVCTGQATWRQLPVPPLLPSGEPSLLAHALSRLLPDHFAAPDNGAERCSSASSPAAQAATALVQGVPVPLDTPLAWLARGCRHPDGFLYVCCDLSSRDHPD